MTADLVEFLRARLDEDQAGAQTAGSESWFRDTFLQGTVAVCDSTGDPIVYDEGSMEEAHVQHIARWNPARVLAEIDAKRRIIDHLVWAAEPGHTVYAGPAGVMLRWLAIPYRDHPDHRPEWAPEG